MLSVKDITIREKLDDYYNIAIDTNEAVIVNRESEKNVVILSLDEYNRIVKLAKNAEYTNMVEKSIAQLEAGMGVSHDLIEDS